MTELTCKKCGFQLITEELVATPDWLCQVCSQDPSAVAPVPDPEPPALPAPVSTPLPQEAIPADYCPSCGTGFRVKNRSVASRVKCPKCGQLMVRNADGNLESADSFQSAPTAPIPKAQATPKPAAVKTATKKLQRVAVPSISAPVSRPHPEPAAERPKFMTLFAFLSLPLIAALGIGFWPGGLSAVEKRVDAALVSLRLRAPAKAKPAAPAVEEKKELPAVEAPKPEPAPEPPKPEPAPVPAPEPPKPEPPKVEEPKPEPKPEAPKPEEAKPEPPKQVEAPKPEPAPEPPKTEPKPEAPVPTAKDAEEWMEEGTGIVKAIAPKMGELPSDKDQLAPILEQIRKAQDLYRRSVAVFEKDAAHASRVEKLTKLLQKLGEWSAAVEAKLQ
jgi:predicted Zn finger-like uncharacterized protein